MVSIAYGQGRIHRGKMRVCILPPAIVKTAFDADNISIISNLFDSYKPYALSMRKIKNVRTKCIIFGKALRIRVEKFNKILPENYSKGTKYYNKEIFKKFPGEHDPGPPWSFSCVLISFKLVLPKKIRLKKCGNYATPFKISRYATARLGCRRKKSGH